MGLFKKSDDAEKSYKEAKILSDPSRKAFDTEAALLLLEKAVTLKPLEEKYSAALERLRKLKTSLDEEFLSKVVDFVHISGRGTVLIVVIDQGFVGLGEKILIKGSLRDITAKVISIEQNARILDYACIGDEAGLLLKDVAMDDLRDVLPGNMVEKFK